MTNQDITNNIHIYDTFSDVYEELHPGRSADRVFYSSLVSGSQTKILDVACGTGFLTRKLAEVSPHVIGIDASSQMLSRARKSLPNIRFRLADMRDFLLDENFDLVICGFNTLQHLETESEIMSTLTTMRSHLAPNGKIALDIFNPAPEYLIPRIGVEKLEFCDKAGTHFILVEDTTYNSSTRLLHIKWRIADRETGGIVKESACSMRQFFPGDLDRIFIGSGLRTKAIFGDFDRSPFKADSIKQIFLLDPI